MRNKSPHTKRYTNSLICGAGAGSLQDTGTVQSIASSGHKHGFTRALGLNFFERLNELYENSWEVAKIVDLPVDDAFKAKTEITGVDERTKRLLQKRYIELDVSNMLSKAFRQERLFGGSLLLLVDNQVGTEHYKNDLNSREQQSLSIQAINVVPAWKVVQTNPKFSVFDSLSNIVLHVEGVPVHESRFCLLSGKQLYTSGTSLLKAHGAANSVFGCSAIEPIWDLLVRTLGSQQAAYHMLNTASSLVISVNDLRVLKAMDVSAEEKLKNLVQQLSVYNAGIVDGKDVSITRVAQNFGAVPELVNTFLQLLSAASGIPVTKFLGTSAQGLNATGEGDARDYYDFVEHIRCLREQFERKILNWIGLELFGKEQWSKLSLELELSYEPLFSVDEAAKAAADEARVRTITSLYTSQLITAESAVKELNALGIFKTTLEEDLLALEDLNFNEQVEQNE